MILSVYRQKQILKLLVNEPGSAEFKWETRDSQYVTQLGSELEQKKKLDAIEKAFTECGTFKTEIIKNADNLCVVRTRDNTLVKSRATDIYRVMIAKDLIAQLDTPKLITLLDWKIKQADAQLTPSQTDESLKKKWTEIKNDCSRWLNHLLGVKPQQVELDNFDLDELFTPKR